MADNLTTPATGSVLATDEIGGVHYPRTKVSLGADGSATDVSSENPLPVTASALPLPAGAATQATLASLLAKVIAAPSTETKQDAEIAALARVGTRSYGAGQQVAIGAASAASTGLTATEVLLHASSRCFVRVATAATSGAGIPLEPGEKFHLRLTSGQQIHVIRDTADGTLNVVPVV